uniref:Gag-Pol polyprotein n=1 Tax=Cajanus cajan TaxID=3821 RepID=A0A151RDB6_CAJCA|nr:Gag-Pol polyprotein [Cajanus cajan]
MYDGVGNEEDKCVKFMSGLRPKIKQVFNYQGITHYHELVNKCRVYDEDNRARVTHYKSGGPMRNNKFGSSSKSKPYTKSTGDSSSKVNNQGSVQQRSQSPMASQTSRGGSVGSVPRNNCFNCGKLGHKAYECWVPRVITCYNCQEKGHKAQECPKNKKGTIEVGGSANIIMHVLEKVHYFFRQGQNFTAMRPEKDKKVPRYLLNLDTAATKTKNTSRKVYHKKQHLMQESKTLNGKIK